MDYPLYDLTVIDHRSGEVASALPEYPWVDQIRAIKERIKTYIGWYELGEPLQIEIVCPTKPDVKEYLEHYSLGRYVRHQGKLRRMVGNGNE